jgi:hypothetical protein
MIKEIDKICPEEGVNGNRIDNPDPDPRTHHHT